MATVDSVAVQADGKILIGGTFDALAPNGGASVTRNELPGSEQRTGRLIPHLTQTRMPSLRTIIVQADGQDPSGRRFH